MSALVSDEEKLRPAQPPPYRMIYPSYLLTFSQTYILTVPATNPQTRSTDTHLYQYRRGSVKKRRGHETSKTGKRLRGSRRTMAFN